MASGYDLDGIYDRYADDADVQLKTQVVKRRGGGRPNRGGGRGNHGKPQGGGGRGRGRGGRGSSQGHSGSRGGGGGQSGGRGSRGGSSSSRSRGSRGGFSRGRGSFHTRVLPPPEAVDLSDVDVLTSTPAASNYKWPSTQNSKVRMQHLHMTSENQDMVRDMLRELAVDGCDTQDQEEEEIYTEEDYPDEYEELNWDVEEQYWTESSRLFVEDEGNQFYPSDAIESQALELQQVNKRGVERLQKYGFEKQRCLQALQMVDGDIGQAIELLLCMCFDISPEDNQKPLSEEAAEQREEEMMALSAIYGDAFVERIANHVWAVQLELPYLNEFAKSLVKNDRTKSRTLADENDESIEICTWYLRGNCKFGSRCFKRHVRPNKAQLEKEKDPSHVKYMYEMEVRFPPGNCYPEEPPLVAFSSINPLMTPYVCLNITLRLMAEARDTANQGMPMVFTLVSLLEDEEELQRLCALPRPEFSNPQPVIYRNQPSTQSAAHQPAVVNNAPHKSKSDASLQDLDTQAEDDTPTNKQEEYRKKYAKSRDESPRKASHHQVNRINQQLKEKFHKTQDQESYKTMLACRQKLPAWDKQDSIMEAVHGNQVVVISGMTGCGKTTQVPQYILDDYLLKSKTKFCNILCTQPRRLSAMAVAQRVAEERVEKIGRSVGYQIRLESATSQWTRLLFCTTGILLRRLEGDALLEDVSHVILDEVHERSEESDFLLMVLRDLLRKRRDLKVILMSATLNADLFADYFGGCPVIEIPGRTFPVKQLFLEDALELTGYAIEDRSIYARSTKTSKSEKGRASGAEIEQTLEDVENELQQLSYGLQIEPPKDNIMDHKLSIKQLFLRYKDYSKVTVKNIAMMDLEKINNDLIESVLTFIVDGDHEFPTEGAILVFLPGMQEITSMYEQLLQSPVFGGKNKARFKLIPLHSTLSSEDQQAVFKRPKEGVTKIVLSTNIAETSITIDDVVFVVDCGKMKEKRYLHNDLISEVVDFGLLGIAHVIIEKDGLQGSGYDASKGMESLDTVWVSRANALQRKGRAGRVAAGVCFHLFTGHSFENHLKEQPIPEIQRVPLEQLVLRIKILDLFKDAITEVVFSKLIEPPEDASIRMSMKRLQDLGALDGGKHLTPLGFHLALLPVDVRIGKLMLFGAIFRCLDSTLTIAATLSFKSAFVAPFDKRDEADKAKQNFATGNSDHLTMLKAYKGWLESQKRGTYAGYCFCQENYLSIKTLQMLSSMKQQFATLLSDIGFVRAGLSSREMERYSRRGGDGVIEVTGKEANTNNDNMKLVAAILVAALYPNVVQVMTPEAKFQITGAGAIPMAPKPEELKFITKEDGYINIHPSSVNFQVRHYETPYLVYHEKVKTSKVYIRDCTMVSVYPLLLFGGGSISIDVNRGSFILSVDDGWIRFMAQSKEVAELVRELRLELDQLLQDKIEAPDMDLATCPRGSKIIKTIVKIITTQ